MSRLLPTTESLRQQIAIQRSLNPDQPGVIRLSCYDAEDIVALIDAAKRVVFPMGGIEDPAWIGSELREALAALDNT